MKTGWARKFGWGILLMGVFWGLSMTGCGNNSYDERNGVFIDSPVQGLAYETAARRGITGADGSFIYVSGERIIFSAGGIVVGATTGKAEITPLDLASGATGTSDPRVVNICRFLQTLDEDADPTNGIVINEATRARLVWQSAWGANDGSVFDDGASIYVSTGAFDQFMAALLDTLNAANVFATTRELKTATGARRHFNTQLPATAFEPYVNKAGIGVSNLASATVFYNTIMGLNIITSDVDRDDRVETTLKDSRPTGNFLVLMHFDDASVPYTNHPVKLVFAVPNAWTTYNAIIAAGGAGFAAPADTVLGSTTYKIGMALDPDGYLLELIEVSYLPWPVLAGVGIGVQNLQAADDIYTRVLGRKFDYFLHVENFMNEVVTISPHLPTKIGLDVVLMNYFNERACDNVPVKLVFTVDDPAGFVSRIAANGLPVLQTPSPGVVGIAKDLHGYELEIVQTPE